MGSSFHAIQVDVVLPDPVGKMTIEIHLELNAKKDSDPALGGDPIHVLHRLPCQSNHHNLLCVCNIFPS